MLTQQKVELQALSPQTWDKPTASANIGDRFHIPCTPIMQVVDKETLKDGRVWLLVKPVSASYTEQWIVEPEIVTEATEQQGLDKTEPIQPAGMAGDSVSCQLQPNWEVIAEYESGKSHGRLDAANGSHLMCEEATCPYSQGYLDGFNSFKPPQPEAGQLPIWRVTWNSKWQWYEVWVGSSWVGRASHHQEAERAAQKYVASEQLRQQHRELVIAAYAG